MTITHIPAHSGRKHIKIIPSANQIKANPITLFKSGSPRKSIYTIVCSLKKFLPYSSEFKISITSSSVTRSSFLVVNRSTTSGTRSKIFVTVS